ncbi:helix-turn-helix domain-containing protein [Flavobacterium branchiicola]|uniref:Helix-turn-helix domain-containing protein n=1 Tax=Flavobacterium branchiicola TaxID=1114875 RepID=A0ABV9PD88_9FLAO|nr:AraC family transcriptional regulator [Flavobacterium branchiicola]MBS7254709.1 helix-turn-helix domain-containing protein [Flavobacterium branchiicola]
MEIRNLYHPFELQFLEVSEYEAKERKNTFFEMVFVLEGKGVQIINDHRLPYAENKLFLIFPQDTHSFEVTEKTKFFFIRFHDSYLKTQSNDWIQKLEFIFHNHNHLPGCILKTISDKPLIRAMIEGLIREENNRFPQQQEVIKQILNTIITIAARNISLITPPNTSLPNITPNLDLLNYVHQHIYQPDQLKASNMAAVFNVSPTYISEYFKTKTGQSIQQYSIAYKIKLIETRLKYTNMQINEIVYEFGFSDASHLNRLFKKYTGLNPSDYKKQVKS